MVSHNKFLTGSFANDQSAEINQLRNDAYLLDGSNSITSTFAGGDQSIFNSKDLVLNHQVTGQQPPAGKLSVYTKADDNLYTKDSGGTETNLSAGGGAGDVSAAANFATDNLLIRSDGILKGVQASGISLDDNDILGDVARIDLAADASRNTVYGSTSGDAFTTSVDNVLIGHNAGTNMTTTGNNVAIGSGSMNLATTIGQCVCIGKDSGNALALTAAGDNNVALGYNAIKFTKANSNIGIGSFALEGQAGASTGSLNVATGHKAGQAVTVGASNALYGHETALLIETGSFNAAIGAVSLGAVVDGSNNTALGYRSLQKVTSSNNTAIGFESAPELLTGTFNICIGHSAGDDYAGAESNNIVLNNSGAVGESGAIRIGNNVDHNKYFGSGIYNTLPSLAATAVQDVSIDSDGQLGAASLSTSSTGLVSGGVLSINGGDATLFDITDGFGYIFDVSTLVKKRIAWSGLTGESSGAHVGDLTYVAINSSAVPVFFPNVLTNEQKRDVIFLGVLVHTSASATFLLVDTMPIAIHSPINVISDFAVLVGRSKFSGMAVGTNNLLTIFSTAGVMFEFNGNYNINPKDPNFVDISLIDTDVAGTYNRVLLDDSFTASLTNILTTSYDVAGVLTTIPGVNDFQNMRIYQTSNSTLLVQPGQVIHNSISEALSAINTETFITAPSMVENGLLIGYLSVQDGATDLANVAEAIFTQAGKFQSTSGGSSGGGDMFGPASSTANHLAVYSDATGKILKDTAAIVLTDTSALSGITTCEISHTATEDDDHALEVDIDAAGFGDVRGLDIQYITGNIAAGIDEEGILVNVDQSASTGGRFVALEILGTSTGSAEVDGLECGAQCHPIRQQSGVFGNATATLNIAVDVTAALNSGGAGNITLFVADNDTFTVQGAAKYSEIELIFDIFASGSGIQPTFEYSDGAGPTTWAIFSPVDGTNQCRSSGIILWEIIDIPAWVVGDSGNFEIRITRTRNSLSTSPRCDLCQISATTVYDWNKDGELNINQVSSEKSLIINTVDALNNTKYGFNALSSNTAGFNNTAIGSRAMDDATTCENCIAIGVDALSHSNITGNANIGIGNQTLDNITSGSENVAVGYQALTSLNTTISQCTAVGSRASRDATTATGQTAFGYFALAENTTGTWNTAVGSRALESLTGGSSCTAMGYFALTDCTGEKNTAIGTRAAFDLTTGTRNIIVGNDSLTNITTGSTNVCIGADAGNNLTLSDSNNIIIDNGGILGDNQTIRIGNAHTVCILKGIYSAAPTGILQTVTINSSGQLGSTDNIAADVSLPPDFLDGMEVSNSGNDDKNISAGTCRDSTNGFNITYAGGTVDMLTSDEGGLDTGSPAANTWYYIHIISNNDSSTVDSLLSLSATAPTLPSGFTIFRMILPIRYNGSSNFYSFHSIGKQRDRVITYEEVPATLRVLNAGAATTYTAVSCTGLVDPLSRVIDFNYSHTGTSTGDFACLFDGLGGSTVSTNQRVITCWAGAETSNIIGRIQTNASQVINYGNSAGSNASSLYIIGFLAEL